MGDQIKKRCANCEHAFPSLLEWIFCRQPDRMQTHSISYKLGKVPEGGFPQSTDHYCELWEPMTNIKVKPGIQTHFQRDPSRIPEGIRFPPGMEKSPLEMVPSRAPPKGKAIPMSKVPDKQYCVHCGEQIPEGGEFNVEQYVHFTPRGTTYIMETLPDGIIFCNGCLKKKKNIIAKIQKRDKEANSKPEKKSSPAKYRSKAKNASNAKNNPGQNKEA